MDKYHNILVEEDLDSILKLDDVDVNSSTLNESIESKLDNYLCISPEESQLIPETGCNTTQFQIQRDTGSPISNLSLSLENTNGNGSTYETPFRSYYSCLSLGISPHFQRNCKMVSHRGELDFNNISGYFKDIPISVTSVFNVIHTNLSDFSFIYLISAQLCQELMPMECSVEFKMGLLLSLVSIQVSIFNQHYFCSFSNTLIWLQIDSNTAPIPIVGITQNTSFANLLMTQIGNLAARFIAPVDKFETLALKNENFVEANPLLLAKGGVHYIGDWSGLNEPLRNKILKNIDCGYITIDNAPLKYPLHTAIWCYWTNYKNNLNDMKTLGCLIKYVQ